MNGNDSDVAELGAEVKGRDVSFLLLFGVVVLVYCRFLDRQSSAMGVVWITNQGHDHSLRSVVCYCRVFARL